MTIERTPPKPTTHHCEDCGEETLRRFRCAVCKKLVCSWCIGHVHTAKADVAEAEKE
jgi:formylmethanofuran dehydrogenase subunit E